MNGSAANPPATPFRFSIFDIVCGQDLDFTLSVTTAASPVPHVFPIRTLSALTTGARGPAAAPGAVDFSAALAPLTADRLAAAVHTAVTNQTMRQRAAELGAKIRAEDGVAQAVAIVQQLESRIHHAR